MTKIIDSSDLIHIICNLCNIPFDQLSIKKLELILEEGKPAIFRLESFALKRKLKIEYK